MTSPGLSGAIWICPPSRAATSSPPLSNGTRWNFTPCAFSVNDSTMLSTPCAPEIPAMTRPAFAAATTSAQVEYGASAFATSSAKSSAIFMIGVKSWYDHFTSPDSGRAISADSVANRKFALPRLLCRNA
jgi:hypothetical protein